MPREEAEAWARSKGMLFLEASAKTRVGIKQVFNEVLEKVRPARCLCHVCGRHEGLLNRAATRAAAVRTCTCACRTDP